MNTRLTILFLQCLAIFPNFSETIFSPLIPIIEDAWSVSIHEAEWSFSAYLLGMSAGIFIWGILSDKYTVRKTLYTGLSINIIACLMCFLSQDIVSFYIYRTIQGFSATACSIAALVFTRQLFGSADERVTVQSRISMAFALSPALGPIIGSFFATVAHWEYAFLSMSIAGIALLLSSHAISAKHPVPATHSHKINLSPIKDTQLLYHSVITGLGIGNAMAFFTLAAFYYNEFFHISQNMLFYIYLPIALAFYTGGYISEKLSRHTGPANGLKVGSLLALIFSILPACYLFVYPQATISGLTLSLISIFGMLCGTGIIIPRSIMLSLDKHAQRAGTASAIMGLIYYATAGIATYIAGHLSQTNIHYFHQFFCMLNLTLLLVIILSQLNTQKKPAATSQTSSS